MFDTIFNVAWGLALTKPDMSWGDHMFGLAGFLFIVACFIVLFKGNG